MPTPRQVNQAPILVSMERPCQVSMGRDDVNKRGCGGAWGGGGGLTSPNGCCSFFAQKQSLAVLFVALPKLVWEVALQCSKRVLIAKIRQVKIMMFPRTLTFSFHRIYVMSQGVICKLAFLPVVDIVHFIGVCPDYLENFQLSHLQEEFSFDQKAPTLEPASHKVKLI